MVDPESGRLAGGDIGHGRLAPPATIVAHAERALTDGDLRDQHVVVTAGGTREAIDPVRVISNRSTGKQGYALAEAAWARGARVTLITTAQLPDPVGVDIVRVESAAQMQGAVEQVDEADVIIMAAAVADFRPEHMAEEKIKKGEGGVPNIDLVKTHDFLVDLGAAKRPGQVIVGFAAETQNLLDNARRKLLAKNLDLIVANDVSAPDAGFAHDTNKVTILRADGPDLDVPLGSKRVVADAVMDVIAEIGATTA